MTQPGERLVALAARLLDDASVRSLVEPTIADLQHEVRMANGERPRLCLAYLRTCAALIALLASPAVVWRSPMRALWTVTGLAAVGSFSLVGHYVTRVPPRDAGILEVFFFMAIVLVLVIGRLEKGGSFLRIFAKCSAVGMTMATTLSVWIVLVEASRSIPWYGHLWRFGLLSLCVLLTSALVAGAAWKLAGGARSVWGARFLAVLKSAAVCAICSVSLAAAVSLVRQRFGDVVWSKFAGGTLVLSLLFAAIATVVYLPVFGFAQRIKPGRNQSRRLAMLGGMLFPLPLLAWISLTGRFDVALSYYLAHPLLALLSWVPYVLAGGLLGRLYGEESLESGRGA